jgi:hypothetical protein
LAVGDPEVLSASAPDAPALALRRAGRLKQLYRWHWISAAVSLVGLLMFAITGITLNHAADIGSKPDVQLRETTLPPALQSLTAEGETPEPEVLPEPVARWLGEELGVHLAERTVEWSEDEIFVSLPRPGGDAWLRIDRASGAVEYERTERGWIAWFNDLHKGRHAGPVWAGFIDVFAVACIVFAVTGLWILKMHAAHRPMAWPLLALGALLPTLLLLLFVH